MPSYTSLYEVRHKRLVDDMEDHIEKLRSIIENNIEQKGDKSTDCQKIQLLNQLKEFEHCVNGIEPSDLVGFSVENTGELVAFPEMFVQCMRSDDNPDETQHYLSFYTAPQDVGSVHITTVPNHFINSLLDFCKDHVQHFGSLPEEFAMDFSDLGPSFSRQLNDDDEVLLTGSSLWKVYEILGVDNNIIHVNT